MSPMGGTLPFGMAHRNALVAPIPAVRVTATDRFKSTRPGLRTSTLGTTYWAPRAGIRDRRDSDGHRLDMEKGVAPCCSLRSHRAHRPERGRRRGSFCPRYGGMTGRLALRATTSCFSDPQRGEHAAILYAALGSAK